MDIITRLKFFMDSLGIPSSQFADACQIPRPTLSQLLNGRNKKISDEIITKIHIAFPELSIPWLMFGEGDMRVKPNIQISEHQNVENRADTSSYPFEYQQNSTNNPSANFAENFTQNRFLVNSGDINSSGVTEKQTSPDNSIDTSTNSENDKISNCNKTKKITSILVFYDDNSFESFTPA